MKALLMIASLVVPGVAFAAGAGGPMDLIPSAVNLTLLLCLIVFLTKDKFREMFSAKSTGVSEMIERASVKAKEAEMMMDIQKKKMAGADDEIAKMESEAAEQVKKFEADYKVEIEARVAQLKTDAGQKIEAEKKEMLNELNSNLLDLVIDKSKTMMKKDNQLGETATKQILEGLK